MFRTDFVFILTGDAIRFRESPERRSDKTHKQEDIEDE